ncbi:UspA domain protein [Thiocapsa sp. KS1]|nr:universal stress protein [Thiocapsa sp. KS1]CRI64213.1 UspA domain protein [Thiocapsa sp. KS1]
MLKFLIPFDGSEQAQRAVAHVIRIARLGGEPRVLVLNVREPANSWQIRSFLNQEEIAHMQESEGEADLRRARELLDEAGVAYRALVAAGPIAQTIAEVAEREGCDHIVMGTHGVGGIAGLLLGSVASKVIHLARVPVTVVK